MVAYVEDGRGGLSQYLAVSGYLRFSPAGKAVDI